jgi:hypothetical protein
MIPRALAYLAIISSFYPLIAVAEPAPTSLLLFEDGPQWHLGDGVNTITSDQHSSCLKQELPILDSRELGQVIDINYLETQADLRRTLSLGAYAAAFGIGTTFSFKVDDVSSSESHEERRNLYLHVQASGSSRRLIEFAPSQTALGLMDADPSGKLFAQSCGDAVVGELEEGAELLAVISIRSSSKKDEEDLLAALKVASVGTGEVNSELRRQLVAYSSSLEAQIHVMQIGLASMPIPSLTDLSQLTEYARTFTSNVKKTNEVRSVRAHLLQFVNLPAFALAMPQ